MSYGPGDNWVRTFPTYSVVTGALEDTTSLPVGSVYHNGVLDSAVAVIVTHLAEGIYKAAVVIPAGYSVGDRWEVWITASNNGVAGGDVIESIQLAINDTGNGNIPVNHNTGGVDALRVMVSGVAVDECTILAYLTSEYSTGLRKVRGRSITGEDGRWVRDMMLNAGSYTLTFDADGDELKVQEVAIAS